jgi:hypothetical protein
MDLINEETSFNHPNSIFGRAFHKMLKQTSVSVELMIPSPIYFRGEIFCEDIEELSEQSFTHSDLLNLLYHDFLIYVQKNHNLEQMYNLLSEREQRISSPLVQQKKIELIHEGEKSLLSLPSIRQKSPSKHPKVKVLQYQLKRKLALRGEVFLSDLAEVYPEHPFTLERVLEIIYIDFIEKFKKGENKEAIVNILAYLNSDE